MEVPGSPRQTETSNIERNLLLTSHGVRTVVYISVFVLLAIFLGQNVNVTNQGSVLRSRVPRFVGDSSQKLAEATAVHKLKKLAEAVSQKRLKKQFTESLGITKAPLNSSAEVVCPQPPVRQVYYINQIFWAWMHTLAVSAVTINENGEKTVEDYGFVKSEPFSFSAFQEWVDPNGTVIASSHQDAITTVTNIYVEDCAHRFLATISEQLSPVNSAISLYTMQNSDGDIVALSTMSKNFGTEVDINDQMSGKRLVTISKGWGQLFDSWSASFRKGMPPTLANDPRVIVMLLAAASSSGSWGLGGFLGVLLNPLWLLFLCCCCCACATAFARAREATEYTEIPGRNGAFHGSGYRSGFAGGLGGSVGGTQYV